MVFLLILSAICGMTVQRAIKFGIGDQRLELLHEERGCLMEIIWVECGGTVRPVASGVSTPEAAEVWSENGVLEVIKNHAKAWSLLSRLLIR